MQQSLQKNQAFFLQGLLFLCKKAVFEPRIGILAEKRGISCARMVCEVFGVDFQTIDEALVLVEEHNVSEGNENDNIWVHKFEIVD